MQCESAQKSILNAIREKYGDSDIDPILSLILAGCVEFETEPVLEIFPDADKMLLESIEHSTQCEIWSGSLSPRRQKEIKKSKEYCCMDMMKSINREISDVIIDYKYGRGSSGYWYLNDYYVSFCPWCGTSLPNKEF